MQQKPSLLLLSEQEKVGLLFLEQFLFLGLIFDAIYNTGKL